MKIELALLDLPEHDLRANVDEDALDELAASLRDHGQLQPIGVKRKADNRFEVVFGARRTRAANLLGWIHIEANEVEESATSNPNAKKLIENVQRLDMTPIEEAYGLADLIGDGEINIRKLQMQTGKSRDWVRTRLELIDLPDDLQGAVQAGVLGVGVARAFGQIENADVRQQYMQMAIENGCTAQQAGVWAANAKYAESGMMTMDEIHKSGLDLTQPPPLIDQHYNCFICATLTNWRRINPLMICGPCQDFIGNQRTVTPPGPPPTPLETLM
jgi:ParB/RepB/Spo0J family partition protein